MSRSHYKIYESEYPYFITSSFVEGYSLLADPDAAAIVLEGLEFLQTRRQVTVYAYVLMENHFHIIAQSEEFTEKVHNFKAYAAKEIIKMLKQKKRTRLLGQLAQAKLRHKKKVIFRSGRRDFIPNRLSAIQ